jgi:hypothetical protein
MPQRTKRLGLVQKQKHPGLPPTRTQPRPAADDPFRHRCLTGEICQAKATVRPVRSGIADVAAATCHRSDSGSNAIPAIIHAVVYPVQHRVIMRLRRRAKL